MAYAVKESSRVQAWELGSGSVMEQEMIRCRKIVPSSWKETGIRKLPGG